MYYHFLLLLSSLLLLLLSLLFLLLLVFLFLMLHLHLLDFDVVAKAGEFILSSEDPIILNINCNDGTNDVANIFTVNIQNTVCILQYINCRTCFSRAT